MSSFLFLTCCFLIIIACSEGAITDAKKLETRRVCITTDFPTGCTLFDFYYEHPRTSGSHTDSQLTSFNQQFSRLCTKACVSAVTEYYRCLYSGDQQREYLEYQVNYIQKYVCGQHSNGDYCPVRLQRGYTGSTTTSTDKSNARAFNDIIGSCSWSPGIYSTAITCSSRTSSRCTDAIPKVSSYMGCCTEPLFGSGVRSCSGVSDVPAACTGVSSATGIMATAPIVAVSLMVFALVGVLL